MKEITYKSFTWKQYHNLRQIISQAFKLPEFVKNKKMIGLFTHLYVLESLSKSTYSYVAHYNGNAVGMILGRHNQSYKILSKIHFKLLRNMFGLLILVFAKKDRHVFKLAYRVESYISEMLLTSNRSYDGEITLLALNDTYRGLGIGKKLLCGFKAYMQSKQALNYYLYTDTALSNHRFYEHQKLAKIAERTINSKIHSEKFSTTLLIYEGTLNR